MNGNGPGSAKSVSPGSTFAPSSGFTGLPEVTPPGHTEQATPVGAPILTPADPWTIGPPYWVMSPCRAAGFPLIADILFYGSSGLMLAAPDKMINNVTV
ncbi:Uncharacterised protein [Escherichia coli]|nr:Uncharacterised protein [Escherichia coli]